MCLNRVGTNVFPSKARGLLFFRLLQQAVMITPVTYREIVGGRNNIQLLANSAS